MCKEAFPLCKNVCVWVRPFMCPYLCKRVSLYVIKILLTPVSYLSASFESEQVGCYYYPANHFFLGVTDKVRRRVADIQASHCQEQASQHQTSYLLVRLHSKGFVGSVVEFILQPASEALF
ncbi:hypothetical protein AMECASPLE_022106 [Ameca splendens]|uniref:Uncharacterized protein n=1 Tax=Ameca splendens TaxID=208324 RepID=A0ABV0YQK8_9TELE